MNNIEIKLSDEQNLIFNLMENTNRNLFITGKAGTGKSYLLQYFKTHTKKRILLTAPTGLAALNISGVTLHSIFGFDNLKESSEIKLREDKIELFKNMDVLVIDEISMVRVDVFEKVDKILKYANKNLCPFGGKQVIIFGDVFQLPPVVKTREEQKCFSDKYGNVFFFNSNAYKNGNFECMELRQIHRQTDRVFIDILNNIREGNLSENEARILNQHYVNQVPKDIIQLVPKKYISNKVNMENLNKINKKEYRYIARITGNTKVKETDYMCDFVLKLKVGALIMMIANDNEGNRWVNGSTGIITELSDNYIRVKIKDNEYYVNRYNFKKYKCYYNKKEQKINYIVESCVSQYPVILSYAITIHKSQGMTYQQVACDLKECFASGQSYVALSRCVSFNRLYLMHKVDVSVIIVDDAITNFYRQHIEKVV